MTPPRLCVIVAACLAVAASRAQAPQPPRFRVAVDVVSIDAVVTDRSGAVVRDLTAADFEVLQDGKPQKIISAQFVPVLAPGPATSVADSRHRSARADTPAPAAVPVTKAQVQRTIVIVVDDLGLSFEGMNSIRPALHDFVDTGLLPTDLTAIMRTGEARSLVQPLTTDHGVLHTAIDGLRYNTLSRKGVSGLPDVVQVGGTRPFFDDAGALRQLPSVMGALAALTLVVQSARELPGRRAVIFASEGFPLGPPDALPTAPTDDVFSTTRLREAVDHVIDQATRAGVLIYAIDGQGLQSGRLKAADDIHSSLWARDPRVAAAPDAVQQMVRDMGAARGKSLTTDQESLIYLSEQTGGFAVLNTNDLAGGLGRISGDVRDYYVIGYQPDPGTFKRTGTRVPTHQVEVRVKRDDVKVRSRKQFAGVADPESSAAAVRPAQQLVNAAISPFSTSAIAVQARNLSGYAPGRGAFVRTVLHIDPRGLTFSAHSNGSSTATLDLAIVVFNSAGVQVDTVATGFDVTAANAAASAQLMTDGLVYIASVPMTAPGGYQLRYAVRDRHSGAIGSGGGFVEIPDVTAGAFALSGIVLRARSGAPAPEPLDSDRFSLSAADALGVYSPGTAVLYSCEIYNAGPTVQAVAVLWRGTQKIVALPTPTLVPPAGRGGFAATGTLSLPADLPAGTYTLQIAAASDDPKHAKHTRAAVQWLTFEVAARRQDPF